MKKLLAVVLCLAVCLGACVFASAKNENKTKDPLGTVNLKDIFEIDKEAVVIRVPEGWKIQTDKPHILDTLAEGEVSDGILSVSYLPVEGAVKKGKESVKLYAYDEASAQYLLFNLKIGKDRRVDLDSVVISKNNGEASVILEDDAKKLTVRLLGNPTTGYQWTYIPDDSGVMELIKDEYVENAHPENYVGVGGTYLYEFKVAKNRPGNKTALRFEYGRAWLEGFARAVMFDITVDKSGAVKSVAFRDEEGKEEKEAKLEKAATGKAVVKADLKKTAAVKNADALKKSVVGKAGKSDKTPEADKTVNALKAKKTGKTSIADKVKDNKKLVLKTGAKAEKADDKALVPNFLDMIELPSDEVLVIRVPEKWEFYITTPKVLDTLAEGERANGILSVSFLPNKAGLGKKVEEASVTAYGEEGSLIVMLKVTPKGKISLESVTYQLNVGDNSYVELTVDGSKKQLEVRITGDKKTGDIWTAIPDNSGVLELKENEPETIDIGDTADVGTLYSWIVKGENKRPGDEGSVIFSSKKGPAFKLNIGLDKRAVIEKISGEAA